MRSPSERDSSAGLKSSQPRGMKGGGGWEDWGYSAMRVVKSSVEGEKCVCREGGGGQEYALLVVHDGNEISNGKGRGAVGAVRTRDKRGLRKSAVRIKRHAQTCTGSSCF